VIHLPFSARTSFFKNGFAPTASTREEALTLPFHRVQDFGRNADRPAGNQRTKGTSPFPLDNGSLQNTTDQANQN